MKCYSCGKQIESDVRVCPFCHAVQGVEAELVEKAKMNDQNAITELYCRSRDNIYYTIKSMIQDEDTVQDLMQDTFIHACRSLDTLQDGAKFQAWVRRIAHNQALDYIKKKKPILFSEMTDPESDEDEPVFVDENLDHMPEEIIDRQETTRLIQEILDTLSEEQRVVVGMYYYEQYSVREIAEMTGVAENTVKSRLRYGREKIEEKVLALEKKGTKLYGLAPIPFLLFLFRSQNAQAASVPDEAILHKIQQSLGTVEKGGDVAKTAATSVKSEEAARKGGGILLKAGGTAAKTAGFAAKGMAAKIVAGIVAAAVLGGAIFYAATRSGKEETATQETTSAIESQTETQTEYVAVTGSGVMKLISISSEDLQNVEELSVWENSGLKRSEIESISFLESGEDIPQAEEVLADGGSTETVPWDISEDGDGSVMAWATDADDNGFYELYIAGTGEVRVNTDGSYLFAYYTNLKNIEFGTGFDTSLTENMASMFEGCESLEELDLMAFETANVTNMSSMFAGCESLQTLDVSMLDTATVTTMAGMLAGCESLQTLDVSAFDTANVTDMSEMFADCTGLSKLIFQGNGTFNTLNVTNMNEMFRCCASLTELDLSGFQTSNVTTMSGMFQGCTALRELNVNSFDTGNVTDFSYMFESCEALTSLDLTHYQTSAATDMSGMFSGCSGLASLDLRSFDTSNVRNMGNMFYACTSLKSLEISGFDTASVVDMMYMFAGLDATLQEQLKTVVEDFNTEKANLNGWFDALE